MNHPFIGVIFVVKKGSPGGFRYKSLLAIALSLSAIYFLYFCNFLKHLQKQGNKLWSVWCVRKDEFIMSLNQKALGIRKSRFHLFLHGFSQHFKGTKVFPPCQIW
jgi:hypothetical protein